MAAGMTLDQFWQSTPYEWGLQRRSFERRMQMVESLVVWHASATLAPHRKGGGTIPDPPFSRREG